MFKTNRSTDYNKWQAIRSVGGELPSPFSTHDLRAFFFGAAAESRVYRFVIIKQACASTKPKMHLILNLRRIFVQKTKYASGIAGKLLPFHVFGNASLLTMSIMQRSIPKRINAMPFKILLSILPFLLNSD